MDEYKRRRRISRAVMSMFLDSIGGSIDNVDVATFDSDGTDLNALVVGIEPIQDLHGYDNPWPAGGGKNIGYLSDDNIYSQQTNTHSFVNNGVVVTSSGNYGRIGFSVPVVTGETYTVSVKCKRGNLSIVRVGLSDETGWNDTYNPLVFSSDITETLTLFTKTLTATSNILCLEVYPGQNGAVITIEDFQVEKGSSATSFSPYSNICPITGRTSVNVIVSPTLNPLDGTITNIPLGGTYYVGQLDVLTGVLTVTHANISSYNGEAINEPWMSSMDAYSPGATPTTGAQVVYPLTTPTTIQLTGRQIATFPGTNYVWCDSGKIIHLEY